MAQRITRRTNEIGAEGEPVLRTDASPGTAAPIASLAGASRLAGSRKAASPLRGAGIDEVDPSAPAASSDAGGRPAAESAPDLSIASIVESAVDRAQGASAPLANVDAPFIVAQTSGPGGSVFDAGMPPRAPAPAAGTAAAAAAGGGASLGTVLIAAVALGAAAGGGGGGGGSSGAAPADTTPPAAPVVNTVAGDDRVNALEKANGITITGTAEAGSTVSVTLGTSTRTAVASTGGAWSVDFAAAQIPADGAVSVLATARDGAGNVSAQTSRAIVIDTAPPVLQSVQIQAAPGALLLTYSEPIDSTSLPAGSAFSVLVDGVGRGVTAVSAAGAVVTLAVVGDIAAGAVVELAYTDPTGGNDGLAIQDLSGNDAASVSLSSGLVSDGYLRGADVYRDTDADALADAGERVAVSNRAGQFFEASGGTGAWLAREGVNADTGVVNTMELAAPANATVINPLTTIAQAMRSLPDGPTDASQAAALLVAALGLEPGDRGLYGTDIVAAAGEAQRLALQLAALDAQGGGAALVALVAADLLQAGIVRQAVAPEDSFFLSRVLAALPLSQASVVADAVTRIGLAASIPEATLAQGRALDDIAPAAPTGVTGPVATQDTTPTLTFAVDATSLGGAAAVAGDRLTVFTVAGTAPPIPIASHVLTVAEVAAGEAAITLPALADGAYTLQARVSDRVGLESGLSAPRALRVDTQSPLAPVVLPVAGDDIIGTADVATAAISGGSEPGATITISFSGVQRTATASSTGSWSHSLTSADLAIMGQGSETIAVVATDAAGNVSGSTTREIDVDTVAPSATVVIGQVVNDLGIAVANGQSTPDNTLELRGTVSGTLGAGEQVSIFESGVLLGTTSAFGGAWSFQTPSLANNRFNEFTARVVDAAGNTGAPSAAYRVDVAAPVPFTQALIGTPPGVVAIGQPTVNGTVTQPLAPGESVWLYDAGARTADAVTFTDETNWTYTLPDLGEGVRRLRAVVEDSTGNQGVPSAETVLTIDTTAPTAPVIDVVADNNQISAAEREAGVTVRGSAEPGSEVTILLAALSAQITTAANGQWSVVFSSGDIPASPASNVTLTATARDAAGNVSAQGVRTVQVDTVAPSVVLSPAGGGDSTLSTADLVAGADFSATAAGAAGVLLQIDLSGRSILRAMTSAGGNAWQYSLVEADLAAVGQGTATVRARAYDAVGNIGTESVQSVTFDSLGPELSPFSLSAGFDSGVAGDGRSTAPRPQVGFVAEAGATVAFDPGTGVFGAAFAATGAVQSAQGTADLPAAGAYTLRLRATDAAGNTSERVATYVFDVGAPEIAHAQRAGAGVTLTASEALQPGSVDPTTFAVTVDGAGVASPASVQADGRSLSVTLVSVPGAAQSVSLAYTPGAGGFADASANAATAFLALVGTVGADALTGSAVDELLVGGAGADTLVGGGGNDTFSFALAEATAIGEGSGAPGSVQWNVGPLDRILDAGAGDRLRLDALLDTPGGLSLAPAGTTSLADAGIIAVRGVHDPVGGTFTESSSGSATLVAWDADPDSGSVVAAGIVIDGVVSFTPGVVPGLLLIV